MVCCFSVSCYFDSLIFPCIFTILLPVSVFLPFSLPRDFITCVSSSVLSLIVHTCVPLLSCINSPCLLVSGRCIVHVVAAMSVACRGSATLVLVSLPLMISFIFTHEDTFISFCC